MAGWYVITEVELERQELNEKGQATLVKIPAGTVINSVVWDGETPCDFGPNVRLVSHAEYYKEDANAEGS